ncbi:MAG TPA: glycoside hydrolase family 35 protein [Terriglobales bacterium]|nr:glycoside hydrolase family 35 protein [Terriglobales bacterium]
MRRRHFLARAAAAAAGAMLPRWAWGKPAGHRFAVAGDQFTLDGGPVVLRSGEMHYPRVPRPYWRDRMRKLRALGLNTLCTYVFWNAHEPRPGEFDFSGNLDLAAYLRTAQQEGLWVILRPGPYVCTEWDFGGFPAWLLQSPGMRVRSASPRFLEAADGYLRRLGREVGGLQITRGGPVVLVQVENEYGSYGDDHDYMAAIRDLIRGAGFEVPLYTADGPSRRDLGGGALPDLPCAINFGDTDAPEQAFAARARVRPSGPRLCGEYWVGWFDHWGERHHTTPPAHAAAGLDWMLGQGISCNLYMAHGGTSFGFMAGANFGRTYQPDTSSYDYDAPIDEAGRPTPKFDALRAVIEQHLAPGEHLPALPPPLPAIEIPAFELGERAPLSQLYGTPRHAPQPLTMEALGQAYGLIWYRTEIAAAAQGRLEPYDLRDYARVYQGEHALGVIDRSLGQTAAQVELQAGVPLDIVVENMGRINFGPHLQDNRHGITERVLFNAAELKNWSMVPLPLDDLGRLRFSAGTGPGPAFYRGRFELAALGDTFLDMRAWGKGYVWVNGHNLGRFWNRGPQQSLFLPGCWLRRGGNEVIVFDWEPQGKRQLTGKRDPLFATPRAGG